jgi:hypothetical protein
VARAISLAAIEIPRFPRLVSTFGEAVRSKGCGLPWRRESSHFLNGNMNRLLIASEVPSASGTLVDTNVESVPLVELQQR